MRCVKCGGQMTGPRYEKVGDVLVYRCSVCGYQSERAPNDRADVLDALAKGGR